MKLIFADVIRLQWNWVVSTNFWLSSILGHRDCQIRLYWILFGGGRVSRSKRFTHRICQFERLEQLGPLYSSKTEKWAFANNDKANKGMWQVRLKPIAAAAISFPVSNATWVSLTWDASLAVSFECSFVTNERKNHPRILFIFLCIKKLCIKKCHAFLFVLSL